MKTGMYQTASEAIREALRFLEERKGRAALRADIRAGFEAIERGEYEDYDERTTKDLAEDIKRRGRQRLAGATKKTGAR
jgi:putative addiction module CopG family antidote